MITSLFFCQICIFKVQLRLIFLRRRILIKPILIAKRESRILIWTIIRVFVENLIILRTSCPFHSTELELLMKSTCFLLFSRLLMRIIWGLFLYLRPFVWAFVSLKWIVGLNITLIIGFYRELMGIWLTSFIDRYLIM